MQTLIIIFTGILLVLLALLLLFRPFRPARKGLARWQLRRMHAPGRDQRDLTHLSQEGKMAFGTKAVEWVVLTRNLCKRIMNDLIDESEYSGKTETIRPMDTSYLLRIKKEFSKITAAIKKIIDNSSEADNFIAKDHLKKLLLIHDDLHRMLSRIKDGSAYEHSVYTVADFEQEIKKQYNRVVDLHNNLINSYKENFIKPGDASQ